MLIGGMKMVSPPCVRPAETPMSVGPQNYYYGAVVDNYTDNKAISAQLSWRFSGWLRLSLAKKAQS